MLTRITSLRFDDGFTVGRVFSHRADSSPDALRMIAAVTVKHGYLPTVNQMWLNTKS